MSGTRGVAVKMGVGDRVAEGVAAGTSGVDVTSGDGEISGVGVMPATAVCVAPEIMVDITAVPRKLRSSVGAGKLGIPHAWVRISKILSDKRIGAHFCTVIVPPSGHPRRSQTQKRGIIRLPQGRLAREICSQIPCLWKTCCILHSNDE